MRTSFPLLFCLLAGCGGSRFATAPVPAPPAGATAPIIHRLESGLRLQLIPRPGAPIVAVQLWVPAGAADEAADERGAAPALGRLLAAALEAPVAARGGRVSTWCSHDATVVELEVAPADLDVTLALLAAAAITPPLDPLDALRPAIVERASRAAADPARRDLLDLLADTYGEHPYGRPVAALPDALTALDAAAIRRFHGRRYGPDGSWLVIAGAVDAATAPAFVRGAFGAWSGGARGGTARPDPATPDRPTVRVRRQPGDIARLLMAFPIRPRDAAEAAAQEVLAVTLGVGPEARLARAARAAGATVRGVTAEVFAPHGPGLIVLGLEVDPGQADTAWHVLTEEARLASAAPPSVAEIERARATLLRGALLRAETSDGQARAAGAFALRWGAPGAVDPVAAVTPEAVAAAARASLVVPRAVALVTVPPSRELVDDGLWAEALAERLKAQSTQVTAEPTGVIDVAPGVRALVVPRRDAAVVGVYARVAGGSAADPPGAAGVAEVVARLLGAAAGGRGVLGLHHLAIEARAPAAESGALITTVARRLTRGAIEAAAIERARWQTMADHHQLAADGQRYALTLLDAAMAHQPGGAAAETVTPSMVDRYFAGHVAGAPLIVVVVGDVDPPAAIAALRRGLDGRPTPTADRPRPRPPDEKGHPVVRRPSLDAAAHLAFGFPIRRGPNDDPALAIIAELLAEGDGAPHVALTAERLTIALRTTPDRLAAAREAFWNRLRQLASGEVSEEALTRATRFLIGQRRVEARHFVRHAALLAEQIAAGGDLRAPRSLGAWSESLRRVTATDVGRVARQHLDPSVAFEVVVGGPPPPAAVSRMAPAR